MSFKLTPLQAGIKSDQLTLALEPEAASIYCQYLYMEKNQEGNTDAFQKLVDAKAKYMVADLGGNGYKNFILNQSHLLYLEIWGIL